MFYSNSRPRIKFDLDGFVMHVRSMKKREVLISKTEKKN